MKRIGIALFPGGQPHPDLAFALQRLGLATHILGHMECNLAACQAIILPFPMSFGGYFRPGALAAHTPLAKAIADFALQGGRTLGIGDGFALLTELKLLPGALLPNMSTRFLSTEISCHMAPAAPSAPWPLPQGKLKLHMASYNANYVCPPGHNPQPQVAMRFAEENAFSHSGIAAISNTAGNVLGMLPIPERHAEADGAKLLASLFSWAL
ncbi:MAG: hypothetical protein FWG75_09885 [Cystobacterineae bacterium]|nr:hypothetical protein [Cystobacterineae bacterium]